MVDSGSLLDLPEELSVHHRRLSVLPPDTPVPFSALGRLWGTVSTWVWMNVDMFR